MNHILKGSLYVAGVSFVILNIGVRFLGFLLQGFPGGIVLGAWIWGIIMVIAAGLYYKAVLLRVSLRDIPYGWAAVWPLVFPVAGMSQLDNRCLLTGTVAFVLSCYISKSYGRQMSHKIIFILGLISAVPALWNVSFLALFPFVIISLAVVHPMHLGQFLAFVLGNGSLAAWIWVFKEKSIEEAFPRLLTLETLNFPEAPRLFVIWFVLLLAAVAAGNFWLLGRMQSLKVWHRRVIINSWVGLGLFPWSLLWGFNISESVWLALPYAVLSLVAVFNWAQYQVSLWLFLIFNAALLILNFVSW